jgi:hypothetical protein
MSNDLTVAAIPATDFSTLCSTPSVKAVLDRAFDQSASFTTAEIVTIAPIASGVPAIHAVDERTIRQSIGTLAAALPAQTTDAAAGKLKLGAYQTMLAGYDERAIAYACRRCLAELDWFPTVHQIVERCVAWVSPEQAAIARARAIIRAGRRAPDADDDREPVSADELREVRERSEAAARALRRQRAEPVAFDTVGELEAHQIRIPNKGDYERLFGIDPEQERAKAEAAERAAEDRDADLLREAVLLHERLYAAAA